MCWVQSTEEDEDAAVLAGAHVIVANATGHRLEDVVHGYVTWMGKDEVCLLACRVLKFQEMDGEALMWARQDKRALPI